MLCASEVFSSLGATLGEDDCMKHDSNEDFYLELTNLDEQMASTDSSKKRNLRSGKSSPPLSSLKI